MGRYAPVSLGDYSAGSNHVLPTGGCACHSSGLSVQTFLKGVNFISYDESAFTDIAATVITLANAEDLPAHGEAMSARFEEKS
jgi:histidinol dehydrogenase